MKGFEVVMVPGVLLRAEDVLDSALSSWIGSLGRLGGGSAHGGE